MHLKKIFEKLSHQHTMANVFEDFLQMAICALSLQRMEEEYLRIAGKYDAEELKLFGQALGAMFQDYEAVCLEDGSWEDVLGKFFEEENPTSQSSRSGQFFTPTTICKLMAQLTVSDEPEKEETITVNDPTCGSGRNLIAHARLKANTRFKTFYVAQDIDYRCVKMCVLNFVMFGMCGVVIHMNTLSGEIWRGYRIWMPETMMMITPLNKEECARYVFTKEEKIIPETKQATDSQTTLF